VKPLLLVAWVVALVAIPAPAYAAQPQGIHYTVIRVDTGDPGPMLTDAEVVAGITWAEKFWRSVPGAPPVTFRIVHEVLKGQSLAPSCGMDVGRLTLGLTALDPTITFCRPVTRASVTAPPTALSTGIDIEARWPADGQAIAHEIGHNLGFDHDRTNETLPQLAPIWEYGNPFSIMGGGQWAPSAVQQAKLGWLTIRPMPKPKGWWRLRDLQGKNGPRAFTFTAKGHVYVLEYRIHRSVVDTPGGVAIYEDGVILHDKDDTKYTVLPGKSWTVSGITVHVANQGQVRPVCRGDAEQGRASDENQEAPRTVQDRRPRR
jgi:hypothetical protein